jgi:copper(I)-binding protein
MTMDRRALLAALALAPLPIAATRAHEYRAGALQIDHPWARPTAPAQKVGAGYLTIRNQGGEADRLVAARTPVVPMVELHTHEIDAQGVARMKQIEAIDVPPGATVELAPGGLHLMLMGLTEPLREGARFPLTLRFERAGEVEVEMQVEGSAAGGHGHGAHGAGG